MKMYRMIDRISDSQVSLIIVLSNFFQMGDSVSFRFVSNSHEMNNSYTTNKLASVTMGIESVYHEYNEIQNV